MSITRRSHLTALFLAVVVFAAPFSILPVQASPADSYSGPYFGAGNLPSGCIADMSKPAPENSCYHMRTGLNTLDSPKVDVLVMVPVSPTAERDMRIMRQSVEMWEGGIDYLAEEMGLDWLKGMDFHISVDYFDPAGGEGGEFTTYPIVDPEIVVIASNPVGGAGIGIDPMTTFSFTSNGVPCYNVDNPFDFEYWEGVPGFNSHHEERSGTYVEDCEGKGGNICFAINGAIDPDPSIVDIFGLFDLVSHEFGHCLTVGHVGDGLEGSWGAVPTNDIMAYDKDPVDRTKCVSTLDVEGVALRMSRYLDVNGDGVVNNRDRLVANDPVGVGDPTGQGSNPFQVQHPDDHLYASSDGDPYKCPQPDLGLVPGERTDWTPESDGDTPQPALTISSPEDGATVPAGLVEISGLADREGEGQQTLTATLSGPDQVATGAPATYSVGAADGPGDLACTITAEGSPARANGSADGCSVDLTWAEEGTYNVTGEVTDGTSTDSESLTVTVATPSGLPDPDGSIAGGITIFGVNPLLAHNELVAIGTGPLGDPAPKFLPGEPAELHTRFTSDARSVVKTVGDTFTWHVWKASGELVTTAGCTTSDDPSTVPGSPPGFDCVAPIVLPSELGRYYTTLRSDADGRWSCHNGEPLLDAGLDSGIPDCIKAFDIVGNTSAASNPLPGEEQAARARVKRAMPYMVLTGDQTPRFAWSDGREAPTSSPSSAATAAEAPSQVPADPDIVDATGDVSGLSTTPTGGLPIDHMDVEAAWFDNDATHLYVGLKLADIPADASTTSQIAYHVNFKPSWVTQAQAKSAWEVPAANTFNGLRVQGILNPVGFDNDLNPVVKDVHHAELQHLSSSSPPPAPSTFGTAAELELISVNPDTDIIWWAVPRSALLNPKVGDKLTNLGADTVPAMRGLFTMGSFYGDSAVAAADRTYSIIDSEAPLVANAGGPYSGAPNAPISIAATGSGGKAPYSCVWSGPPGSSFADAGACDTSVTFTEAGTFSVDLTLTDAAGNQATASAPAEVAAPSGERVEIYVDGTNLAGAADISTSGSNPTAGWTVPIDLGDLSGQHQVTARWFDTDDTMLSETSIAVNVEQVGPDFDINITTPNEGTEVGPDFVVEGITDGTSSEAGGGGSRASTKWKRAVKVIPEDHLKNMNHGPPVPADSVGIGPGSTLISYFDGAVGICTAAFIWRDPSTAKVYIGAAGHCFMDTPFTATHGPGADYNPARTTRIRVCVSTCLGGATGLGSAAIGLYPSVTRDLGKLAYARQTLDGVDIGNDFGIVEIPPSLHDQIRTDLPVWNGPNTAEFQPLAPGALVAQYGNGIGLGEVFPTKARVGRGASSNASSWLAAMATSQGDSGSAVVTATATAGTSPSVEGQRPLGMLTHLSCCVIAGNPYTTAGTTIPRAVEMAREAGINLELIHDRAQLAAAPPQAPTGLTATGGDGTVGLSWTAPSNGGAPISGYTVKWGTQAGGPYPNSSAVTDTQTSIDGLSNGVTYHFVVSATNSKGEGPNSAEVSATPSRITSVPGAPTGLSAVAGDGQAALSWQAPADNGGEPITGYTVRWGTSAGGPYPNTAETTETAATVTGLTNGMTYHFVVSANNVNGESANSDEVAVTPEAVGARFAVEVRLGSSGEWTAVDAYDGRAWSKAFNDVANGDVTVEARLLDRGTEVARDSVHLVVDGTEVTTVAFTDASADAGRYGDQARIAARLTDEAGAPIQGAELVFEMTGAEGVETWTVTTNDQGVGSVERTLTASPGTYNLTARFAGVEGDYEPHSDQRFFVIEKEQTVTDLVVTGKGSKRRLTATLAEDDGPALGGREFVFYVDGTEIGRATTNANGVATLAPPQAYRGDRFNFEARFDGTNVYQGSADFFQT